MSEDYLCGIDRSGEDEVLNTVQYSGDFKNISSSYLLSSKEVRCSYFFKFTFTRTTTDVKGLVDESKSNRWGYYIPKISNNTSIFRYHFDQDF